MNMYMEVFLSQIWAVLRYIQFYISVCTLLLSLILEKGIRQDQQGLCFLEKL